MSHPKLQDDPGAAMLAAERSIPWFDGPDENLLISWAIRLQLATETIGGTV